MRHPPLVLTLKTIIERSYGLPRVIANLAPFIVGDRGYRTFYGNALEARDAAETSARVLIRQDGAYVRAAVYYPDALVRHLERFNPLHGIGDENIDAFAALVEELDHLILLATRAAGGRAASLLELEYHAGVTKYLVVLHFLAKQTGRRRLSERYRRWARHHLFERYLHDGSVESRRYRTAALLAGKYVRYLERMAVPARLSELKALNRRPFSETRRILSQRA